MSAKLIYKQLLTLDTGQVDGLLMSKDTTTELSETRLKNLKSQSLQCSIHVKGGPVHFSALLNTIPDMNDPAIEEGDSLDVTTNDDMVNLRLLPEAYSVISVHYHGQGKVI